MTKNIHINTVTSFGDEWSRFDQSRLPHDEAQRIFNQYFSVFPWDSLPEDAVGFDMGCGSGRWAKFVAPRVGHLHCIDPSAALSIAQESLSQFDNISFHSSSVDDTPLMPASQDFGYSLGVLHHIPDTSKALQSCTSLLKKGAPFLVYLYYRFDDRSPLYVLAWRLSELLRRSICILPSSLKHRITDLLALVIYLPLSRLSLLFELLGLPVESIPLSYYRHHSFYTMRTDSRDRFGTPLERRFTRAQIFAMMRDAGLSSIRFSNQAPFWCAVGYRES